MTAAGARLRVDPIACDGRGLCAEVLPELITLDDWGFPIIADEQIPPGLMAAAGEAIRLCPLLALRLDRPGPSHDHQGAGGLSPRPPLGGGAGSPRQRRCPAQPGLREPRAGAALPGPSAPCGPDGTGVRVLKNEDFLGRLS